MPESSVTGNALPFEPLNPNPETIAAMEAARSGELFVADPNIHRSTRLGSTRLTAADPPFRSGSEWGCTVPSHLWL
jgi:hypothetical protein